MIDKTGRESPRAPRCDPSIAQANPSSDDISCKTISCKTAKSMYGIYTRHSRMPTNNEIRLRLISETDGTAYIRTQGAEPGGWQNSHYHKGLVETYAVQRGWVCYAELTKVGSQPLLIRYAEGAVFTTRPLVAHNIYMSAQAVIHTIKHGNRIVSPKTGDDWWDDSPACQTLQIQTREALANESELLTTLAKAVGQEDAARPAPYNEYYRHFDNLIWAIPAVAMAALAAGSALLGGFLEKYDFKTEALPHLLPKASEHPLVGMTGIPADWLLIGSLTIAGAMAFFLSYSVHRFRFHQARTKWYPPRDQRWNPQVGLQLGMNAIALVVLWLVATLAADQFPSVGISLHSRWWLLIFLVAAGLITFTWDKAVRAEHSRLWTLPNAPPLFPVKGGPISAATVGDPGS